MKISTSSHGGVLIETDQRYEFIVPYVRSHETPTWEELCTLLTRIEEIKKEESD